METIQENVTSMLPQHRHSFSECFTIVLNCDKSSDLFKHISDQNKDTVNTKSILRSLVLQELCNMRANQLNYM